MPDVREVSRIHPNANASSDSVLSAHLFPSVQDPIRQPEVEETAALEAEIAASLAQVAALPEMLKKWRRLYVEEVSQLEEQAYIREEDVVSLQKENCANKELLRNYEEIVQRHTEDAAQLKAQNSAYSQDVARLEEQNRAYRDVIAQLEKKNQTCAKQIAGLREKTRTYAETIAQLKEKNRGYPAEIAQLKEENHTYTDRVTDLQRQLAQERANHAGVVMRLEERNRLYAEEAQQHKGERKDWTQMFLRYGADIARLEKENRAYTEEIARIRKDHGHAAKQKCRDGTILPTHVRETCRLYTQEIAELRAQNGIYAEEVALLKEENRVYAEDAARLKKEDRAHATDVFRFYRGDGHAVDPARQGPTISATLPGPTTAKAVRHRAMNADSDEELEDALTSVHRAASPPPPATSQKRLQLEYSTRPTKCARVSRAMPLPPRPSTRTRRLLPPGGNTMDSPYFSAANTTFGRRWHMQNSSFPAPPSTTDRGMAPEPVTLA